ncbi:MAG: GAF domain-containing protein [Xenococcaceae cyanobacterium MO_234.B1]|nr:GAF domain-containing protein [Xenococcaceae cyanobacterium MO_234.B1]
MDTSTISVTNNGTNPAIEDADNTQVNQQGSSKNDLVKKIKTNLFKGERERANKIIKQIRQAKNFEAFLVKTVSVIRQNLKADRVLIYQFEAQNEGRVIAESIIEGWTPTQDEVIPCSSFGGQKILDYQSKGFLAIQDVKQSRLTPYQKQLLEKFQVRASLSIPITLNSFSLENDNYASNKVWGLLVVQQCSKPRSWEEEEINLLDRIATELTIVVEKNQPSFQFGYQQDILGKIDREMQELMQDSLHQIRESLKADRALVYAFNPDWSGQILTESVGSNWAKAGSYFDFDYFLKTDEYKPYYVVNDIYTKGFARCLVENLEALQAKAYIVVPIEYNNQLLGVLGIYQNSSSRNWQKSEVNQLVKQATKFALPLQQTLFLRNSQFQTKQMEKAIQREKGLSKMLERMQIANDEKAIFQVATQEGRKLLQADRLAIYRFNDDWSGEFIAESVASGWSKLIDSIPIVKDTFLQENQGGRYKYGECFAVDDIYMVGHQACHIELLEQFEARAYAIAPIFIGDMTTDKKLWGLVAVYQNSGSRKWKQEEIDILRQIGLQVGIGIGKIRSLKEIESQVKQQEKIAQQERAVAKIVQKIQQSQDLRDIFRTSTNEVRQLLECDRVVVYQFKQDWSGEVLAESMSSGWTSVMQLQETDDELYSTEMNASSSCTLKYLEATPALDNDTYFKLNQGGEYTKGKKFQVVNDVYSAGFSSCYLQSLEKYQAKAYIIVPIFQENKLWGLFAAYQNSGVREWQANELNLLLKIAPQLGIAIEQAETTEQLRKTVVRQKSLAQMVDRMGDTPSLENVLEIAAQETRKLLTVARTSIYRFNSDWSGANIVEVPIDQDFKSSQASCFQTTFAKNPYPYLQKNQGGSYKNGESCIVNDVSKSGLEERLIGVLERLDIKAYVRMPIFVDQKLWGIINIYQSQTRVWQEDDLEFLKQIVGQIGIVIQQKQYLEELQTQAQQEKAVSNIVQRIGSSLKLQEIFRSSTQEVRKLLQVDRAVVYRFNPDWTGEVLAESAGSEWVSIMEIQETDETLFSKEMNANEQCTLKNMEAGSALDQDTYFINTQGGDYTRGKKFNVVNDVYSAGFSSCYLRSLEKYQARAYIIVPIFQENKLWGLFAVYQNSGAREWKANELNLLLKIAPQLGIAIEQAEKSEQLRIQSENLSQTLAREKAAKEELQKQAVDMLRTVRPAFSGDLTVRAKVTENEIGTIAGAYNTTLDSLKQIVLQVQEAVGQVAQTTQVSSGVVENLSFKSQKQLEELQAALDKVKATIKASNLTTQKAQKVEVAIEQADRTVKEGDRAMNKTVDSIVGIRQTVADAGKRVKRLSDSSQKISRVVNLISSFAAQTNLLALNAALEATRAGEYGKGFAVVADEVRNLSLQSSEATIEIEKLVREIQDETQEVSAAMEAGVQQVAEGTSLVNDTRDSLNAIVTATDEIRALVQDISSAASEQTQQAESVTQVMGQVAEIANETSDESQKISASFQQLEKLANNLQSSVAQFKVK